MKSDQNIFFAFLLNILFSVAEFVGGIFTGSIAIISDALHDFADAASIAVSAFLERMSKRPPDSRYTFGYGRYSVIGGAINAIILLVGSMVVVLRALGRLVDPSPVQYDGMIIMAIIGAVVNFLAAYVTHGGHSINEKTVKLHMLEDVLGWIVVLIGAIVMRFTDWWFIDPLMSIGVAVFIFIHAVVSLRDVTNVLLEKAPEGISVTQLKDQIMHLDGVTDAHHIHLWSLDGRINLATVHIVANNDPQQTREQIRHLCTELGISHITIEIDAEKCHDFECTIRHDLNDGHHHHNHCHS